MFFRAIAYAPLAPFAALATAGIVVDRYFTFDAIVWFSVAGAGIACWLLASRRNPELSMAGLWLCTAGLAGALHHIWRNEFAADDIGHFASIEPKLVRIRGTLNEEPTFRKRGPASPLVSRPTPESTTTIIALQQIEIGTDWRPASGKLRLTVEGEMSAIHVGDEVEITGLLSVPPGPLNPGEWDYPSHLLDERIRAEMRVPHSSSAVVRLSPGAWSFRRTLTQFRNWGQRGLTQSLGSSEGNVANALLLGDTAAMSSDEWDRFVRTGVIHVLAISGQHLVILGAFLWIVLRICGVRTRPAAIIVAATLLSYALMTGGRPSAMRAAIIACCVCGGVLLRRRALPANTFALAWLVVLALNPTDLFSAGFQLSFLCVAILLWGIPNWFPPHQRTPLEELIHESRSLPERGVRAVVWVIYRAYLTTLILGIATAPLIAYWQNIVSPAGIVIGPAAILLTTLALIAGLILIIVWPLGPVAAPFAWLTGQSLRWCESLVNFGEQMPGGCWYVGSFPAWWVIGFYAIGLWWLAASVPERFRAVPRLASSQRYAMALTAWSILGLLLSLPPRSSDEMRITFLAVDHGSCAIIETPDGRVLLYDAGSTSGPNITKRRIAPFLWSRGIRRIDEVFISHADLDHFNGLNALLERFPIGQITLTPTFVDRPTGGAKLTYETITRRGIAVRTAKAGDQFTAGDVTIDVLHPPQDGPPGIENVRSMVLLVRHGRHSILLTGDLEGAGLDRVASLKAPTVDVLLAPHHGSGTRAEILADWAKPKFVVSSQGRADGGKAEAAYNKRGVPYWSTWPDGAITIRSHATGLIAESFATGKRKVVATGQ